MAPAKSDDTLSNLAMIKPKLEQINNEWHATVEGESIPLLDQDREFASFTDGQIKSYLVDMKTTLKSIDPNHTSVKIIETWYRPTPEA